MSAIDQLIGSDRVLDAIHSHLRGTKRTPRGLAFNCPVCTLRGETPDRRFRGMLFTDGNGFGISCYNCEFKTRFKIGDRLNKNVKIFLECIGVPSIEISRLNYWSATVHSIVKNEAVHVQRNFNGFTERSLPDGARSIIDLANSNCTDSDFLDAIEYLYSRGDVVAEATTYYWTPDKRNNLNRRIIIPCYYDSIVVGWTARSIDKTNPKYFKQTPQDFLFNSTVLTKNRSIAIITEGVFDALAIDGVGLLGTQINDKMIDWIKKSEKRIICVPDLDSAGKRLIDIAIANKWEVSCPRTKRVGQINNWWGDEIKDVDDAVRTYGRLYTLKSIIESATDNTLKLRILQKSL